MLTAEVAVCARGSAGDRADDASISSSDVVMPISRAVRIGPAHEAGEVVEWLQSDGRFPHPSHVQGITWLL